MNTSRWRVFATAKPSLIGGPVEPMAREDAAFWEGRERAANEARQRRAQHGRKS